MSLLEVQDLTKNFGGLRAVDHCSFTVEEGSITAVIGPNGAGKTTVFNLITGLHKLTSGKVLFDAKDITGLYPHQIVHRGISRTFQVSRELMEMTVLQNLVLQSPTRGILDLFKSSILKHEHEKAMDLLDFLGIAHLANEEAKNLSYGQKKLLEFAAVLMSEPRLVLLDEPAGGVNPALFDFVIERIEQLNRDGMTFLIIEHNMDVVMNLSHFVVVMAYGKVLKGDTPDQIQRDPAILDVYLGEDG